MVFPTASPRPSGANTALVRRRIVTYFTGGLDGALRILSVLRWRRYRVYDLTVEMYDGVQESKLLCTIMLNEQDVELLFTRLCKIPSVIAADPA